MASKCIFCFERMAWRDLGDGKRRGGDLFLNRLTIGVKSTKMPPSFCLSIFRVGERHLGDAWRNLHSLERMDDILCLLRNAVFYVLIRILFAMYSGVNVQNDACPQMSRRFRVRCCLLARCAGGH